MSFWSTTRELALVFDISSGSVGAAFVHKEKNSVPMILAATRVSFRADASGRGPMLTALHAAAVNLFQKVGRRPDKIYCILSAPWAHGEVRTMTLARDKEFTFTEKIGGKLVADEVEAFKNEWKNLRVLIDKRITRVALNGYHTRSPHGRRARAVAIDAFLSLAPRELISSIEETIHRTFKTKIMFTSQMFADFIFVRDIFQAHTDFLVVNIGAAVTEISLVKDDNLVGTGFFPMGADGLVAAAARTLGTSAAPAKSLIAIALAGHLETTEAEKVAGAIGAAEAIWLAAAKQLLLALAPNRRLPHTVFLSDTEGLGLVGSVFSRAALPEFTTTHGGFDAIMASTHFLHDYADFSHDTLRDASLTRKAIFINRM